MQLLYIYAYRIWKADTYSCRNERQLGYIFVYLINIGRAFLDPALLLSPEGHSAERRRFLQNISLRNCGARTRNHRSPGDSVTGFEICVGFYPHILKPLGPGIIGNMIRIPNKMVPSEGFFIIMAVQTSKVAIFYSFPLVQNKL